MGPWHAYVSPMVSNHQLGGSFEKTTAENIETLWDCAAQHGGKDIVPLESFLKTREANHNRKLWKAF